jgi:hypothetical protein
VICRGRFQLDREPDASIDLFTPEGERPWAGPGWDPRYPAGEPSAAPGTVFTTEGPHGPTVWVIVEASTSVMRYVRVVPGLTAGTVSARCTPAGAGTEVEITYDLVALGAEGQTEIEIFAGQYASFLATWPKEIRAAGLGSR